MTALLFALPSLLGLLILTGIGLILYLPLAFAPTAALYLTAALLLYWPVRLMVGRSSRRRQILAGAASLIVLLAGVASATMLNRHLMAQAESLRAGDRGREPVLGKRESMALVRNEPKYDPHCSDECQRLLFSGLTKTVLIAPPGALEAARTGRPFRLMRHRVVPRPAGCGRVLLSPAYLSAEWGGPPPPPLMWGYQDILAERGLCLRSEWTDDPRAEAYLVELWNPAYANRSDSWLSWLPNPRWTHRREVLVRSDSRWTDLMRQTEVEGQMLFVPLAIEPPFDFDTHSPGRLLASQYKLGREPHYDAMLGHWIRDDVRLPELARARRLTGSQ